jgi:murein DD-endopeptidase MepM/ murein hydrolase activator NlpD
MKLGKTRLLNFGGNLRRTSLKNILSLSLLSWLIISPTSVIGADGQAAFLSLTGDQSKLISSESDHPRRHIPDPDLWTYYTQSGDTLRVIARRFQVSPEMIYSPPQVGFDQLLDPGLMLIIPRPWSDSFSISKILPDGEVVYSPSAAGFDTLQYIANTGGFLGNDQEYMRSSGPTSAAEIVARVAVENSINPRLLLAILDYHCHCVTGPLQDGIDPLYLMGVDDLQGKGLYRQLGWVVNQLSLGYYGWRRGLLLDLVLGDGTHIELPPDLNAGSAAIAYLFSRLYAWQDWSSALDREHGFLSHYKEMFPDTNTALDDPTPLFPPGLTQPELILPFQADRRWGFTSGPHKAWETEGAEGALDFAPSSAEYGCIPSNEWVVAMADGLIIRSEYGAVVIDLDGDGFEGSGWNLLYMHLESRGRVAAGSVVRRGDPIGHPSCEGGPADGTHVHIARKFNGEWIAADGSLPFVMSDWRTQAGYRPFEGHLVRGSQMVIANPLSPASAFISQSASDMRKTPNSSRVWWREE